jgi:hypothetical protein
MRTTGYTQGVITHIALIRAIESQPQQDYFCKKVDLNILTLERL